ncbi:hypothetical protein Gotur_007718 [Gossypium turneri]
MDRVGEKASNGTSTLKFANGEADFGEYQKIYTRMQCTPDLARKDCDSCLSLSVSYFKACCHGKKGGYVRRPNCYFRWELYPFYTSNATPPPLPVSLPPQSANTNTKGKRGRQFIQNHCYYNCSNCHFGGSTCYTCSCCCP